MSTADRPDEPLELIDPFHCRMWDCHDRLQEFVSETTCREVIDSFLKDGQKQPVLARPLKGENGVKYELVYGARRLFAARHLNVKLLARVRNLDDRLAFVEMDIENRLRRDISPYERGMSFRAWLREGHFHSQEEIAKTLGMSTAHVCRLMKFAELPTAVVLAFPDPRHIRESWAVTLAERCSLPQVRNAMVPVARSIRQKRGADPLDAKEIYKVLIGCSDKATVSRVRGRDEVVMAADGQPLFRVSYRHNDLHVVIRRAIAPPAIVELLTETLRGLLDCSDTRADGDRAAPKANGRAHLSQRPPG